ncbi:MAG: MFS transporter [Actinomycetia bacterium]|nr:MFS transporter [Actinomycetes bacterium]
MADATQTDAAVPEGTAPDRAPLVLVALILVAAVANLNLAVANVALPDIGQHFDASQTGLDIVAIGFSLGLAASVLWLGALGDRYGRKQMVMLGMALSIPASIVAAWAPSMLVLSIARLAGGVAAGMAFPTTLALITALWSGAKRTRAIALWSAIGGGFSALGPLASGALLEVAWWGSVFLITLPLAVIAFGLAAFVLPNHVNEATESVDNLGGALSVVFVATLVLAINLAPVPGAKPLAGGLAAAALLFGAGFVWRQKRAANPLYDLDVAARRLFWVAALAGVIVFGSLMGAMFIGQQYLQDVLGYSTLEAGAAILPAVVLMILVAPRSARLVGAIGSRYTLLIGYAFCVAGFLVMLLIWGDGTNYAFVALAYMCVGAGVGFAGTPASNSLTGSVPVWRAGMASATADLQRDLGGAIMQSVLGALLTAGYARAITAQIDAAPSSEQAAITDQVQQELQKSFSSAVNTAERYPQYAKQIVSSAQESFVDGQRWAYAAGIAAALLGALIVATRYPDHAGEKELLERYHAADAEAAGAAIRQG